MCCIYMRSAPCVLIMHVHHVSTVMCASNQQCSFLPGSITSHCSMINVWYWQSACVALKWNNRLSPAGAVHSVVWHIISDMDSLMICWVFLPFFLSCFLFPVHLAPLPHSLTHRTHAKLFPWVTHSSKNYKLAKKTTKQTNKHQTMCTTSGDSSKFLAINICPLLQDDTKQEFPIHDNLCKL